MATNLDRETVLRVARLARLKLADAEIDDYSQKLGTILKYVEQLNEVVTDDVEPMAHAVELKNVFREDCLLYTSPSPRDGLLSRMPSSA